MRNQADCSEEHATEINQVFNDFGKAIKKKGNFIDREIDNLSGVVNKKLQIGELSPNPKLNLTESGTQIVDKAEEVDTVVKKINFEAV